MMSAVAFCVDARPALREMEKAEANPNNGYEMAPTGEATAKARADAEISAGPSAPAACWRGAGGVWPTAPFGTGASAPCWATRRSRRSRPAGHIERSAPPAWRGREMAPTDRPRQREAHLS
jgi:hypothetical protein